MGTSTTNDQVLHLELDLTVPEVIDLQVEIILAFSFVVDVLLQQVAQGSVLRWEVGETVFAPLVDRIVTTRNLHDD